MPQISYIKYSDVTEARRYDAEYFKPKFLERIKHLNKIGALAIDKKATVTDGEHGSPDLDPSSGIYYLSGHNVKDNVLDLINIRFCSKKLDEKNIRSRIKKNHVLLSIVGTVGNATVIYEDFIGNTDRNVATIKDIDESLNPYFISTFLNSNYGKFQTERFQTGNVQPLLNLTQVRKIKIPILPQTFQFQIEQIVKSAHQKQTQSKQLYHEAEQLLLVELGLLDYEIKHSIWFITTKNKVDEARRYDSEYFQPKYVEIIKKIENYDGGWDLVKNQFKQNTTLSKKEGEYCNYIEISDINTSNGEITPNKVETKDIPANGKRKLFKNDLLISKVRPYRGAVSFIDFEVDNLIGSGAFTILQEKTDYKKEVLMIFLKTQFIKDLLLRYNCGTSYPVIKDGDILGLKIPLIKPSIQKKISEKIQESHRLRKESKELLEDAKEKVEKEIEK